MFKIKKKLLSIQIFNETNFSVEEGQRLANNVYLTGGLANLKGKMYILVFYQKQGTLLRNICKPQVYENSLSCLVHGS